MSKMMLALVFATIAIAGCKKNKDNPIESILATDGLFTGNVIANGNSTAIEALLRLHPGDSLKITSFQEAIISERGHWQLQENSFKATFANSNNDSLKMTGTWNADARTLNGTLTDFSGQNNIGTFQLVQKEPVQFEGKYNGTKTNNSTGKVNPFTFTIRPGGTIEDNFGAVGTWKLHDDLITATFPAKGDQLSYTFAGFHNPGNGTIQGDWRDEKADGPFKVTRQSN